MSPDIAIDERSHEERIAIVAEIQRDNMDLDDAMASSPDSSLGDLVDMLNAQDEKKRDIERAMAGRVEGSAEQDR